MSFPFKNILLLLVPPAALVAFLSYPTWMPDGSTEEALRETLLNEKGFQLTGLGSGYKTIEISFNDPAQDYRHRLLICTEDAPRGCEDIHEQIAGPSVKPRIDKISSGDVSPAAKELTTYLRGALARSERPRGFWKTLKTVYRAVIS